MEFTPFDPPRKVSINFDLGKLFDILHVYIIEHIYACLFTFCIALILLTIANVICAKTDRHAGSVASVRNYTPRQTETCPPSPLL